MTYKLVPHESGKYTVEFENNGCRPATDVEVELFKQRDELLAAQWTIARASALLAIEKCKSTTGQRRRIDMYVSANQCAEDILAPIARVKGGAA